MTKKLYIQPAAKVVVLKPQMQLMAGSIQTEGLGEENLNYSPSNEQDAGEAW